MYVDGLLVIIADCTATFDCSPLCSVWVEASERKQVQCFACGYVSFFFFFFFFFENLYFHIMIDLSHTREIILKGMVNFLSCPSYALFIAAGCDIGVQISVRPYVRPFVRSFVRPSVNIYVEV